MKNIDEDIKLYAGYLQQYREYRANNMEQASCYKYVKETNITNILGSAMVLSLTAINQDKTFQKQLKKITKSEEL